MPRTPFLLPILLASLLSATGADERVRTDAKGRIVAVPLPIAPEFLNPLTPDEEEAFLDRANHVIRKAASGKYGNTYFENEKSSYPKAMLDFLAGNRAPALTHFQEEDNQAGSWNSLTKGIDFFPAFTLKGQMRKYYFFGQYLDPAYKKRMFEGAKLWTAEDPMRRANPYYKGGPDGWTPETKNSWVDVRNTDNLRAMRESAVYLMAEETGNKALAAAYKEAIRRYVWALYNIGMGEWDSENYHAHTMTGYIQLYDFAKDPEVRMLAKGAMDWLLAAGAVKYYNGGFAGPIKRDYHHPYVFGGAAGELWLYFGDTPEHHPSPHADLAHFVTSAYRPPMAVLALAKKRFAEPVEILASKPEYENWKVEGGGSAGAKDYPAPNYWQANHAPAFHETTFIGKTFQMGSLPQGSHGDVNGFKLLMRNSKKGADFFTAASVKTAKGVNTGSGNDRIAQAGNLLICLSRTENADWTFQVPEGATIENAGGWTFLRAEQTWLALRPIRMAITGDHPEGTPKGWTHARMLAGKGQGVWSGFALEVGDSGTHASAAAFQQAVLQKAKLVETAPGVVELADSQGRTVKIDATGTGPLPQVFRNGQLHDWSKHWDLYQAAPGAKSPITLGWKKGQLTVEAGGWVFEGRMDPATRTYAFRNTKR